MNQPVALLLIDLQNAFCSPRGSYCVRQQPLVDIAQTLRSCRKLHRIAAARGILTVFTKIEFNEDYSDAGLLVRQIAPGIRTAKGYARGRWDGDFTATLRPSRGDLTVSKTRYDPFVGTDLEAILRKRRIRQVVIGGVLTNVCVESCARSAFDRDFGVNIVRDATTTYSAQAKDASLGLIRRHFGRVISTDEAAGLFESVGSGM